MNALPRPDSDLTAGERLRRACDELESAERALAGRAPTVAELHAVIDGAMRTTEALAEVLSAVIRQAPVTLDGYPDPHMLGELLADLHALRGSLTPGTALLAPARDDLQRVLDPQERNW